MATNDTIAVRRIDLDGTPFGPIETEVGGAGFRDVGEAVAWAAEEATRTGPGYHLWTVYVRDISHWRRVQVKTLD